MKKVNFKQSGKQIMVDGMLAFGMLKTGQHTLDFACCEDVVAVPFAGKFKVQAMRDGNVYMTELPQRKRNHPIFREDNASLSLGRDNRYYFCFSLPQALVGELPHELVRQASAIAQKVLRELKYEN